MPSNFADLKRNSVNSIDALTAELTKLNQKFSDNDDPRFWQPTVDKDTGNGFAIIRFLPPAKDNDQAFVRYWEHGFQGPGGWYIEKSLTTINQPDPVSEYNNKLWNSGVESNKDIARKQKRNLYYVSNILVVDDPEHPENNGTVRLYRYGQKIFDKITDAAIPQFKDEEKLDAFNPWAGANFRLKVRKVDGYRNYDKSEFDRPKPIGSDEEIEEIWAKEHDLREFVDPAKFKSYEVLKARLDKVLGIADTASETVDTREEVLTPRVSTRAVEMPSNPKVSVVAKEDDSIPFDVDDPDLAEFDELLSKRA